MGAKLGGGGGNKYDLGQNSDINVTPFVDVMLVLLIIFMVAAPLATVSIALDLPPAIPPNPDAPKPKEPTFITIQNSGAIFVKGKQSSLHNLPGDIQTSMIENGVTGNFTEERVFVSAQSEVQYDLFMQVLNTLQQYGYLKIGLINEEMT